jgi:hypothetical protein
MNRKHIHINTTDVRWAIALAGAVQNAKNEVNSKINGPFSVSFEKTTPEIEFLSEFFDAKPEGHPSWEPPQPELFGFIDEFSAKNHQRELEEQHGIKQDLPAVPLYLSELASNSMIIAHNVFCKPDFFYPKFSKKLLEGVPGCDGIVEFKTNIAQATAFLRGMGISDPVIYAAEDLDTFTAMKMAANGCKLVFTRPMHYLQFYQRSRYTGYDNLANDISVVSLINDTVKADDRYLVSWSGQIPVFENEPVDTITAKGQAYSLRKSYDFDHRKFFKDYAEGKINGRPNL